MNCPNCGKEYESSIKICERCGETITKVIIYPKVPDAVIDRDFADDIHPQFDDHKIYVAGSNQPISSIYETEPTPKTKAGKGMITRCLD